MEGGYDFEFLDSAMATDYQCMICHYVAKDPQQAQCCGATYCSSCITRSRSTRAECPNCRAPSFILIQDEAQQQKINKLKIKCPHCDWNGAVADIQTHTELEHPDFVTQEEEPAHVLERAEVTAHARSQQDWSFSEFQKSPSSHTADVDDDVGDECEPLIELKQLATADHESLKAGNDEQKCIDVSPKQRSTQFFTAHCMDVLYATKATKV